MKDRLKAFFTEHWKFMAVSAACRVNLFDQLASPKTPNQLASDLSLHHQSLTYLLDALHECGFIQKQGDTFQVNPVSVLLTEDHPESLKYACMNWSGEHLSAWQNLDYSLTYGKSSFENLFGVSYFDYLNEYPDKLHAYHRAMYQYAKDDYKALPYLIDLKRHRSLMDVGGGYGAILEIVKNCIPELECILFDLESVVCNVSVPGFKKIGGSFFDGIPTISDAIILSRVLHDWDDARAKHILENCKMALPSGGSLFVIENCTDLIRTNLSLLSLNMTVMCQSYERSSMEYIELCSGYGFRHISNERLNELQTILVFES